MPERFLKSDEYVSAVVVTRLPEAWRERREAEAVYAPLDIDYVAASTFFWMKPLEDYELF